MEKQLKTGTTTLGIKLKDKVILAADMQATAFYVESKRERKIFPITKNIAITTSGSVGDLQFLTRLLKVEARLYEMSHGNITPKALTTFLSNILQANKYFPYIVGMLIGGYGKNGPELYSIDPFGGVGTDEDFFVSGSGGPIALGVLEASYREDMSEEEAIELAKKAITAARERDVYTGGRNIIVAVIDKDGYREFIF